MPTKTKFRACYESLLRGEHPWMAHPGGAAALLPAPGAHASSKAREKANAAPRTQFYMDLLCLPVEKEVVLDLLAPVSGTDLTSERFAGVRENIHSLWKEALRTWTEEVGDELRQSHAIETLLALAWALLPKHYANYTLDVISIIALRMAEADDVFYALVAAIDHTLRDGDGDDAPARAEMLENTLALALVCVAYMGRTSLATYFLHRDLFSAAMHVVHTRTSVDTIGDATMLVSLLAMAGQTHGTAHAAGLGLDPVSSAVLSTAAFQPYQQKLREYSDSVDMARIAHALSFQFARIVDAYRAPADTPSGTDGVLSWTLLRPWAFFAGGAAAESAPDDGDAPSALPPPRAVLLVCVWLFVHTSEAFTIGMIAPPSGEPLIVTFYSLASYLLTHAAGSGRAAAYAHTVLQVMAALLGPPDTAQANAVRARLFCDEVERSDAAKERGVADAGVLVDRVQMCRQKANPLPLPPPDGAKRRRRLVVPMLDNVTIFFKYNRSKRLDAPCFITALVIVQRAMLLCAQQGILLEYDWLDLWRAMLDTAAFLGARHTQLVTRDDPAAVAQCLLETFAVALIYSDKFLQTSAESHLLLYELARNRMVLERLLAVVHTSAEPKPRGHARRASQAVGPRPGSKNVHWALVQQLLDALDAKINAWREEQQTSASHMFALASGNRPPSAGLVMRMIQSLDLPALLSPVNPVCAAVLRASQTRTSAARDVPVRRAPAAGTPSPNSHLLRYVQTDLLAVLESRVTVGAPRPGGGSV
ncbi:hypothetical protein MSPP1_001373 [Malassezia sp. CBS 17886]|nr:hypothetical protein MSPP1_001373 [Malassezia sp. CBS 17886]